MDITQVMILGVVASTRMVQGAVGFETGPNQLHAQASVSSALSSLEQAAKRQNCIPDSHDPH